jgi:prepilin-type N-terminal cleavage/methylation domain-containing protein
VNHRGKFRVWQGGKTVADLILTKATICVNCGMKNRASRKSGFTLVEIMIVAAIIGLLAAIAIPNFVKARVTSQANACINNLRQLDSAMQQYAIENRLDISSPYTISALRPYIRLDSTSNIPSCPASGIYSPGPTVTNSPTCSLSNTSPAHSFH